jgi:dTDP-4-dehydrorhamnose reductase
MKIVLSGAGGQVGHELSRTLLPLGPVLALDRAALDLADLVALRARLEAETPACVVNAAAWTAVDRAEAEAAMAHRINVEAVDVMAQYARRRGALLVHYSTDYVFDGSGTRPWRETDPSAPQSVYGRTKREGEQAIEASGCRALVLRTSWVHGAHGGNFICTMLRLAAEREQLSVVADQIGAPTGAELIADVTALAVAACTRGQLDTGLYHLCAAGETSWYGLATHVIERARERGLSLRLPPGAIKAIATADYPTPARRPLNSRLDASRLSAALGLELPDWRVHADRTVDAIVASMA